MPTDLSAAAPFPQDLLLALRARPLIPLAAALVLGIVVAEWAPVPVWVWALVSMCGCAVALAGRREGRRVAGLLLAAFGLGAALHAWRTNPHAGDPSRFAGETQATVTATVSYPSDADGRFVFVCVVTRVTTSDGVSHAVRGEALLTLPPRGSSTTGPGQVITLYDATIRRPPAPTNWFQLDERERWDRRGIHCMIAGGYWDLSGRVARWAVVNSAVNRVRWRIGDVLRRAMPGKDSERELHVDLLGSMVFGAAVTDVDRETAELFRRTGTIHLLVVSGAQVTLIVVFLTAVMGGARRMGFAMLCGVGIALMGFGLIVGTEPSVVRALLMAAVALLAAARGRRHDLPSAIALAALVLCIADTATVFDVGAQLTFAATVGVSVAVVPREPRRDEPVAPLAQAVSGGLARDAALGTAGAWLLTTPILVYKFYSMALVGTAANLVAVPLSGPVVVLGLAAAVLGSIWLPLATPLCAAARVVLAAILFAVRRMAAAPLACVEPVYLSAVGCWVFFVLSAAALYLWRTGRWRAIWARHQAGVVCGAVAVFAVGCIACTTEALRPAPARIMTFDAGEGQCTLIENANRGAVLIDAGSRGPVGAWRLSEEVVVPYLARRGIRRLDAVVISHADIDHYGALQYLCRRVAVGWVILGPPRDDPGLDRVLGAMTTRGARLHRAAAGHRLQIAGCDIEVLWPPAGYQPPDDNASSLVLRVCIGGHTALFPGDLEKEAMEQLLQSDGDTRLGAEFLQVPHHGRGSSALPEFYWAVEPAVAVVSQAGEAEHRQGEALCRTVCRRVLSTEDCGAVLVMLRPGWVDIATFGREME